MNVSVIIPAYNAAKTIEQTLESVLAQTFQDWEAIVIDDGSTDTTAEIASTFASRDKRIRLVRQSNGGEAAARNTGVHQARHEWLVFLDSDDWIAPLHLEKLTAEWMRHPDLDAMHCGSVRVAQDGTEVSDNYQPPAGDLFPILARRPAFPVHACMVRAALVTEVGAFDTSLKKAADWDLWQRLARAGARFGAIDDVLAYYRMTPNSASLDAEPLFRDVLTVLKRGHAPDPRVPNPEPKYKDGYREQSVASQEFYLLSWSAGLLIGAGQDARPLFKLVNGDCYPELHAPAIARTIFEAAILPAGRTPNAWEDLWPKIHRRAETFLAALEEQSRTPDLAEKALPELKRLVLRHSLSWGMVIRQDEETIAKQQADIERLSHVNAQIEEDRARLQGLATGFRQALDVMEGDRSRWQTLAQQQEHARNAVELQLAEQRQSAEALEREKALLHDQLRQAREIGETLRREKTEVEGELSQARELTATLRAQKAEVENERDQRRQSAEALERERASLEDRLGQAQELGATLRHEKTEVESELSQARELTATLRAQKAEVENERDHSRQHSEDLEIALAHLKGHAWVRLGSRLRIVKQVAVDRAETGHWEQGEWQLRVVAGSSARLVIPANRPRMVRIEISRAAAKTPWDIQLNQAALKVRAHQQHTLRFWARADGRRSIGVGCAQAEEPWANLGLYERIPLTRQWRYFELRFIAVEDDDNARIHFDAGGREVAVELSSVILAG